MRWECRLSPLRTAITIITVTIITIMAITTIMVMGITTTTTATCIAAACAMVTCIGPMGTSIAMGIGTGGATGTTSAAAGRRHLLLSVG